MAPVAKSSGLRERRLTACLNVTALVASSYGYDSGKSEPTRCTLIGGRLGDQCRPPLSVLVCDSLYLAAELVSMARDRNKDWISLLKKNRNLETNSFAKRHAYANRP